MKISESVLSVLSVAETDGNILFLTGDLDRKMYLETNKVLEAAGGKWNRKLNGHLFETDAGSRLDEILTTGEVDVPKDEFNFFPSPPDVVSRLMDEAEIVAGMTVLEPSAGDGAIASKCLMAGAIVDCRELMPQNYDKLKQTAGYNSVTLVDFLALEPVPKYDRVVMNPPFMKQLDIVHVTHALKFLKPGGRLVSVMSSSVLYRKNKRTTDFLAMVDSYGGVIDKLPDESFKSSGTKVGTVVVVINV